MGVISKRLIHSFAVGLAFSLLCAMPSFPQAATGVISGTVVDESGAVVPGAEVSITSAATSRVTNKISSEVGTFVFPALTPGIYKLTARIVGFKTFRAVDIKVDVGKEHSIIARLELGEMTETVTVTAGGAELIATTKAEISSTVREMQIRNLPLNGRNPISLMTLNAGVADNGRSSPTINGNRVSYTSISMDGVNIQDNFIRSNATNFVPARPTVDQVGEFTLISATQGSDSGFGSSQVNLVTPTGTNSLHGSLYWFHRNSALGANDFFNNKDGIEKEFLIRHQYGFSVGGPVLRDRLLFFVNWEGQRINQSSNQNTTVPTSTLRQGIFTYTATSDDSLRQINLLNTAGVGADPFITSLLQKIPTDFNNFRNGDSTASRLKNTAGYSFNQRNNNARDQLKFRLDYILNDRHSFEGTYQALKNTDDRPDIDGTFNAIPINTSGTGGEFSDFVSTAWKWSISPRLLNEVRFGAFLSPVLFTTGETFDAGFKVASLGFTNPIEDFERQGRVTDTWTLNDNASWQVGAHSLRFGFQSNFIRVNSFTCFDCVPEYSLGISTAQTIGLTSADFPGGVSSTERNSANDFLATLGGILSTGTQNFTVNNPRSPQFVAAQSEDFWEYDTYAGYFGDTWRLNSRMSLNMGLRWEYSPNLRESNGRIVQIVPKAGQTMFDAALDPDTTYDLLSGSLVDRDLNNFAPSFGFAWDVLGKSRTVLRGGYSISYVNDEAIRSTDTWLNRFGVDETANLSNLTGRIAQGVPAFTPPAYELPLSLSTIAARNAGGKGAFGIDRNLVLPYIQSWNFGVQHEIGWNTALEVRYVGTKGTLLRRGIDLNQVIIFENGFLDDFVRARSNGFLAEAAGLGFDPRYNAAIPGSQQLTVFPQLPFGGLLTNSTVRGRIQQGLAGDLGYIYQSNNLTGGFPFAPNPNANFSDLAINQASSTYHAMQAEVRRRFKSGLQFNANYTFAKNLTDASGSGQTNFDPFIDIRNPGYDRGRASFDVTHVFNANFIFEMPFGRGRWMDISNPVLDHILGGWNVTSIFTWTSGDPFGIVSGRGTLNRNGRSGDNRADSTLNNSGIRNLFGVTEDSDGNLFWINPSVTNTTGRAVAPDGQPAFAGQEFFHPAPGALGGLPRNAFNGPRYFIWDMGILKDFRVTEDVTLQFRGEFFNFPNHTNFDIPSNYDIDSSTFGQLSSTRGSPRVTQFAVKIIF